MSEEYILVEIPNGHKRHKLAVGEQVIVWGHTFTVQPGKKLQCEMHRDYVHNEVKAGRVVIVDEAVESETAALKAKIAALQNQISTMRKDSVEQKLGSGSVKKEIEMDGFTQQDQDGFIHDPLSYFGCQTPEIFKKRLTELKPKGKLVGFCKRHFKTEPSDRLTKPQLIDEIMEMTENIIESMKGGGNGAEYEGNQAAGTEETGEEETEESPEDRYANLKSEAESAGH